MTLTKGQSATVTATIYPTTANQPIAWKSNNPTLVEVTRIDETSALIKALGTGSSKVTVDVIAGDHTFASCEVNLSTATVPATAVSVSQPSLTLTVGESSTLTASVTPSHSTDQVVWSTSNDAVASVQNGVVYAKKSGTATITATAGDKSAYCAVTVNNVNITVNSITFSSPTLAVYTGKNQYITVNINATPADALPDVTWSSSAPGIVAVLDAAGDGFASSATKVLSPLAAGKATITASSGGKSATCEVTVEDVALKSIRLTQTTLTLAVGRSSRLIATGVNNDGSETDNLDFVWSTNAPGVASVTSTPQTKHTGNVEGLSAGPATITVSVGNIKAECQVQVRAE